MHSPQRQPKLPFEKSPNRRPTLLSPHTRYVSNNSPIHNINDTTPPWDSSPLRSYTSNPYQSPIVQTRYMKRTPERNIQPDASKLSLEEFIAAKKRSRQSKSPRQNASPIRTTAPSIINKFSEQTKNPNVYNRRPQTSSMPSRTTIKNSTPHHSLPTNKTTSFQHNSSSRNVAPVKSTFTLQRKSPIKSTTTSSSFFLKSSPTTVPTVMSNNSSGQDQKIKVCIRKRPLNKSELSHNEQDIAPLSGSRTIEIHASKIKVDMTRYTDQHSFTFDNVFDSTVSNTEIYQKTAKPLVDYMFQGGKSTCFAYGQTGSGKTYTMLDPNHGLYSQATRDIFSLLNSAQYNHLTAWVGYYEIYQGHLHDLLNNRARIVPREDGSGNVVVKGLKEYKVDSSTTMMNVFKFGNQTRTTCKTQTNETSSRSHAVLQILLKPHRSSTVHGKLNFIDLAGSERGSDRGGGADTKTRMEGAEINRSLLALKECIRALDQEKRHAPFRGSKLTMVLRDSFIGASKTCMIATISPNNTNSDHTLNTLRYADRVKELRGESDPRLTETTTSTNNDGFVDEEEFVSRKRFKRSPSPVIYPEEDYIQPKITAGHVRDFIYHHKLQIEETDTYLQSSKQLIQDLGSESQEHEKLKHRYRLYQMKLNRLLDTTQTDIEDLQNKIKQELADE